MATTVQDRYSNAAVALHWLIAVLIFASFPLGWISASLRLSPLKLQLVSYHKWVGVTVFIVAIARLVWRSVSAAPRPLAAPAWQHRAADLVHWSLYALMFALPLTGWIFSSATGVPTVYLGLWQLPDVVGRDRALASVLRSAHEALGWALLALVLAHAAAALKHHFVDRDGLLRRMSF
ncbi:MAG TPA: cytochrome b [Burkholderiaceae bacterium]|nr:cytochrome b [Burkholderiaceae bacterium]